MMKNAALFLVVSLVFSCNLLAEVKDSPAQDTPYVEARTPSASGGAVSTFNGILSTYDPALYLQPADELSVLALNLHTYQEADADAKLNLVVKAIAELNIDLISFEECAQNKDSAFVPGSTTIRVDNMAYLITSRLKQKYGLDYQFKWDWAHYGWNVWEEGIAVVSKHPLGASESKWMSTNTGSSNLLSRKAIFSEVDHPVFGTLHFFTAHLHWQTQTNNDQTKQINNLQAFVAAKPGASASIIGGDFNMQPTELAPWYEGYQAMTNSGDFIDTFLAANPAANDMPENSLYDTVKGSTPGRIDYIFLDKQAPFTVLSSQILFTPAVLGEVSDHYGVLTRLRRNPK